MKKILLTLSLFCTLIAGAQSKYIWEYATYTGNMAGVSTAADIQVGSSHTTRRIFFSDFFRYSDTLSLWNKTARLIGDSLNNRLSNYLTLEQAAAAFLSSSTAAATYQPIGSYALTSQIPTNLNQLTNGPGYITGSALSGYALTSAIPTNNTQLTNGAGYITSSALTPYLTSSAAASIYQPLGNYFTIAGNNIFSGSVRTTADAAGVSLEMMPRGAGRTFLRFNAPNTTVGFGGDTTGMFINFDNLDAGYPQAWAIYSKIKAAAGRTSNSNHLYQSVFYTPPMLPVFTGAQLTGLRNLFMASEVPTSTNYDNGDWALNSNYNGTSNKILGWVFQSGTWREANTLADSSGATTGVTIVNNATTTTANTILDGRMGKTLSDAIATKQGALTLTTTGSSGAATLTGSTLNIPQYSGGTGLSYPNTTNKYLNGYGAFPALNTDSTAEGTTNKFYTDARARAAISLTTIGSSGAATYNSTTGALNIPQYSGGTGITYPNTPKQYLNGYGSFTTLNLDSAAGIYAPGVELMRGFGMPIVAQTVPFNNPMEISTTASTMTDGTMRFHAIAPMKTETVYGAYFILSTVGVYTADNTNGLALYEFDPSTGLSTKVAETANDATIFTSGSAGSTKKVNFTAGVTVTKGKSYYLAYLFNASGTATTAPQIGARAAVTVTASPNSLTSNYSSGATLSMTIINQTAFPATINVSTMAIAGTFAWGGLHNTAF